MKHLVSVDFAPTSFVSSSGKNTVNNSDDSLPPAGGMVKQAFEALMTTLKERKIQYAIIGGLATIQHTSVRTTDDVDVLLTIPQIALPGLFEALAKRGFDVDVVRNIHEFRDDGLTTVRFQGVMVDLMRPLLPTYANILNTATDAELLGQIVRVVSVEGLIIMKLIALRPQDEADIQELLVVSGSHINMDYVRSELNKIINANDPRWVKLDAWVREAGAQS